MVILHFSQCNERTHQLSAFPGIAVYEQKGAKRCVSSGTNVRKVATPRIKSRRDLCRLTLRELVTLQNYEFQIYEKMRLSRNKCAKKLHFREISQDMEYVG